VCPISNKENLQKDNDPSKNNFVYPGGNNVPMLAAGGIVWLQSNLNSAQLTGIAISILLFYFAYFFMKQVKKNNQPAEKIIV